MILSTETPSGKVTISKKTVYIAIVLVVVIIGAFAVFFIYSNYLRPSTNDLRITLYEREFIYKQEIDGEDYMWGWLVRIKIRNYGTNDVDEAELVVELKEDHSTIDSSSESFHLQAGWGTTESVIIQAKQSEWLGKNCILVATIYLDSEVLDQYTTSW